MLQEEHLIPYTTSSLPPGPYLVFAPHPDDETLGMGGTIALASAAGIAVHVVVLTDGEIAAEAVTRKREAQEASRILGMTTVEFWGLPDRRLAQAPFPNEKLFGVLKEVRPRTVFLPALQEFHPDHRATTNLLWEALCESEYEGELWLYEISRQSEVNRLIDITSALKQKLKATRCYQSQLRQNNYESVILGLNQARSYTLGPEVTHAEGFWTAEKWRTGGPTSERIRALQPYLRPATPTKNPLVSVIVRTKDRPHLLREALESVAAQTYPYIEAVVVNDGGKDVAEVLREFEKRIFKTKWLAHEKNVGRAAAANTGIKAASGKWVGLLDDDDVYLQEAIASLIKNAHTSYGAVYGHTKIVRHFPSGYTETLGHLAQPFHKWMLLIENFIPTCGIVFKRELALKVGLFDEHFEMLEDWDFFFRLAQVTDFLFISHEVAHYRVFGEAFITSRSYEKERPWREMFYSKHLQFIEPENLTKGLFQYVEGRETAVHLANKEADNIARKLSKLETARAALEGRLSQEESARAALEGQLSQKEAATAALANQLAQERSKGKATETALQQILSSYSWKITAPLRSLKSHTLRSFRQVKEFGGLIRKFCRHCQTSGLQAALNRTRAWTRTSNFLSTDAGYSYKVLQRAEAERAIEKLEILPRFSILLPVYNTPEALLRACLDSVVGQYYPNWELCIADDASDRPEVRTTLEEYRTKYLQKIKVVYRETNGHISAASNSALDLAEGEFFALLDHDDELTPDALLKVAEILNVHPQADMIYSDEDKIDENGSYIEPFFKPDWAPEMFDGQMYTCHLGVYRRKLVKKLGGFREGFEGAQDYDLVLRLAESTEEIFHIPQVLYHWRKSSESTSSTATAKAYAFEAGLRAVQRVLDCRGEGGQATSIKEALGCHLVRYPIKGEPLISIVIPTRDLAPSLDSCLNSIVAKTNYQHFEIIIVDNGSQRQETFRLFSEYEGLLGQKRFRVIRLDIPFNFSELVNAGAQEAAGDLVLLLNNDVEVQGPPTWLEEMGGYAQRNEIGCVGAVLLYPDGTIQHAGVILGLISSPECPGVAGHSHKYLPGDYLGYFTRLRIVSNYSAVTGACLMVRRELWEKVGGFAPKLSIAFNDVDFCLRLRAQGYRHVVLPHVRLTHHESKSRGHEDTSEKQARFQQEIGIMRRQWAHELDNDPYYNKNLTFEREDFSLGEVPRFPL